MRSFISISGCYICRHCSYLNEGLSEINAHNPRNCLFFFFSTIIEAKFLRNLKHKCVDTSLRGLRQEEIVSVWTAMLSKPIPCLSLLLLNLSENPSSRNQIPADTSGRSVGVVEGGGGEGSQMTLLSKQSQCQWISQRIHSPWKKINGISCLG